MNKNVSNESSSSPQNYHQVISEIKDEIKTMQSSISELTVKLTNVANRAPANNEDKFNTSDVSFQSVNSELDEDVSLNSIDAFIPEDPAALEPSETNMNLNL